MSETYKAPAWVGAIEFLQPQLISRLGCSSMLAGENSFWIVISRAIRDGEIRARYKGQQLSQGEWAKLANEVDGGPSLPLRDTEVHFGDASKWINDRKPSVAAGRKRGRKQIWKWDECWAHVCCWVARKKSLPRRQEDVVEVMAEWFRDMTGGDEPSESEMRRRVKLLYDAWKNSDN
jgi:hypothetical protein